MAHGDAVVAVGGHGRTASHRTTEDGEAFRLFLDPDAAGGQAGRHQGDAVAFLDPHLTDTAHHRRPLDEGGRGGQHRIFVDHRGRPLRRYDHAPELRMPGGDVADLLAPGHAAVRDGQVRAHLAPGLEQAGAQRVEHDALDRDLRPGDDQPRRQREGGRRRVAGHGDGGSRQWLAATQAHTPALAGRRDSDLDAEGSQHPLGMIPARLRLRHRGDTGGVEPGQQDSRLDLGGGDGLDMVDRRQTPAADRDRQAVPGVLPVEPRAHVGQGPGHPLHRTFSQAGVAVEGHGDGIARRRPHQQANPRPGVAAVDDARRLCEPALPRHPPAALAQPFDRRAKSLDRAGRGQDVVAFQQAFDPGHARRHGPEDQGAMGDGLVTRCPHPAGQRGAAAGGQMDGNRHPAVSEQVNRARGRRDGF